MNNRRKKPSPILLVLLIIFGINFIMDTNALNFNITSIFVFIFMFSLIPFVIKVLKASQNKTTDNEYHSEQNAYQNDFRKKSSVKEYACDYCGDMVPENTEYCPHCGAAQLPN